MHKYFKNFFKSSNFRHQVISVFLYRELAFLILPLLILYPLSLKFGAVSNIDFFASSNFAFVVVVLMAMNLSSFIELKAKIQRDINYKLLDGQKQIVLTLIIASITMTIILLTEFQVLKVTIDSLILAVINALFFLWGIFLLFLTTLFKLSRENELVSKQGKEDKFQILSLLKIEANRTKNQLLELTYFVESFQTKTEKDKNSKLDYTDFKFRNNCRITELEQLFEHNEKILKELKISFSRRKEELK